MYHCEEQPTGYIQQLGPKEIMLQKFRGKPLNKPQQVTANRNLARELKEAGEREREKEPSREMSANYLLLKT